MATLVLSSVGAAVGGPIGSAIGAIVGQAIDARIFRPKARQGPRLAELKVQTSSYGTQIPQLFGTMRVAGTVIWATDLKEHRGQSGGGKGRASTTTYSYTASFAVALSSRAIRSVGRVWADGRLVRGAAGDWKVRTGFRLYRGNDEQVADPLIAAAEGASAPAHRGIAYAVFEDMALEEFGNRIPSLTFEVTADAGAVTAGGIAAALAGEIVDDGAELALDGFAASGESVRAVIEALAEPAGAWFAADGARIVMRAGAGAAMTIVADPPGDGAARTVAPIDCVPKALTLLHHDPARDWQAGAQSATRAGAGRREERIELAAAIDAGRARGLAAALLRQRVDERVRRRVALVGDPFAAMPGDRVTPAGESGVWRVRRATIEGMAATLDLMPIGAETLAARPADPGRVAAAPDDVAGTTLLVAAELPSIDGALLSRPRLTIVAAGSAAGWRRANLLVSVDGGASWIDAGMTGAPAVVGTLAAALPAGPVTLVDDAFAIEVMLARDDMTLVPADAATIDAGANLALVGDELVQFASAVRSGGRRWRLGGLRRGARGTPTGAAAGARFALIEPGGVATLDLPVESRGAIVTVMASGVGDAAPVTTDVAVGGVSIAPPAPVGLALAGDVLRWRRRARGAWRWLDGVDAPLGEETERYSVEISTGRTANVDGPSIALDAGERIAGTIVTVRQIGTWATSAAARIIL